MGPNGWMDGALLGFAGARSRGGVSQILCVTTSFSSVLVFVDDEVIDLLLNGEAIGEVVGLFGFDLDFLFFFEFFFKHDVVAVVVVVAAIVGMADGFCCFGWSVATKYSPSSVLGDGCASPESIVSVVAAVRGFRPCSPLLFVLFVLFVLLVCSIFLP